MSGTSASTGRAYLPTTERSLLWDDDNGHMYKLITSEFLANRFTKNGSQSVLFSFGVTYFDERCTVPASGR